MSIWKITPTLEQLNKRSQNCIHDALGIQFTSVGDTFLEASMPVDHRTKNPIGILHGGASVVLAESLGSVASLLVAGPNEFIAVGIEINASHLKSAQSGRVFGKATSIRLGKSIHVWDIQIRESEKLDSPLICQSRLTVMIKPKN